MDDLLKELELINTMLKRAEHDCDVALVEELMERKWQIELYEL